MPLEYHDIRRFQIKYFFMDVVLGVTLVVTYLPGVSTRVHTIKETEIWNFLTIVYCIVIISGA